MRSERSEARAELKVAQESLRTFHRERVAQQREERERGADRRAARQWAEVEALLPGEGGVGALVEVQHPHRDFEAEEAELLARIKMAEERLRRTAKKDAPELLGVVATATKPVRRALAILGETAIPLFIDVLATLEPRQEALAAVAAVERDLRGDPRVVSAQRAAIKRYADNLLADATQAEIAGLLVFQLFNWARRGSSPLEPTWTKHDIPLLGGSVLTHLPVIGGVVRDGSLPL